MALKASVVVFSELLLNIHVPTEARKHKCSMYTTLRLDINELSPCELAATPRKPFFFTLRSLLLDIAWQQEQERGKK